VSVVAASLQKYFSDIINALEPIQKLPTTIIKKTVSLKQRMGFLRGLLAQVKELSFRSYIAEHGATKADIIITFLATLELIKQHVVEVHDEGDDIRLVSIER